ncbi:MAG: hypothetical protein SBU_000258 [Candidatus Syntrophoarchaeum butanivorans]|uniref:Uncharacterized protein n=1 Tax=Candidatus Syntropharchaeum butanivorans TaxID=1839936 RepID=A0A1F2P755_9EURY|nr:MAG: hypothetical protein SBU_000258 [Candidatus Syntrophoarchaeum butanivorans]
MEIVVSGDEIKEYEILKIISQLTPIKEKIKYFENKYGCTLEEFERRIKEGEEKFDEWDDYIEWKAYVESLRDLERKLREIKDAKDIRIA